MDDQAHSRRLSRSEEVHGAPAIAWTTSPQQALELEPKFQALLESAPDAIVIVDSAGRIVIANSQTERLFGYSRSELIGQPIERLLPEHLHTMHVRHRAGYFAAPHTRPMGSGLDLAARRKDGSSFPVEISLSAIQTEAGPLVTSVIRDISEHKQAEVMLRRQATFARLLQVVAVTANEASTIDEALRRVIEQICTHLSWPVGHAYLYADEASGTLAHTALWHLDDPERFAPFQRATEEARFAEGAGLIGGLLGSRRPAWIDDVTAESRFMRAPAAHAAGIRAGFAFPVLVGAQVVAVLEFYTTEPALPDEPLLDVMTYVGAQLGRVAERQRAAGEQERQVRRRTAHLNTLLEFSKELLVARGLDAVLQRAVSHAMALVPEAQSGALYLYDARTESLALRVSSGFTRLPDLTISLHSGISGSAFTSRRTLVASSPAELAALIPDLTEARRQRMAQVLDQEDLPTGAIAMPLIAYDQVIGVLLLLRKTGDGPFSAEALATLDGLANLTAAAILEERSARETAALSSQLANLEEQQRTMVERLSSAEAAMLQAARLSAVGQLAASIAHEINNPLYAARNCLYLLEQDLRPENGPQPYLEIARDQLTRIAGIIERMRDFYRPGRGDMAPHDLNQLLEGTLELAELNTRHAAIQVIFTPAPNLPSVLCNGDQFRQVFLNLILNAIDAMPDGGTLTVRTAAGPTVVLVEVQDTGIGIPPDIRARLFEPFFTNKSNGTGLGLSISAHIITQHGGQIEVDSAEGQGTTFRVVLPYQPDR